MRVQKRDGLYDIKGASSQCSSYLLYLLSLLILWIQKCNCCKWYK